MSTWQLADESARARVMDTTYSDVQVEDGRIVSVSVTPEAEAIGLHYALPEQFVLARPAGDGPAIANIPIVGRREWESAIRSA